MFVISMLNEVCDFNVYKMQFLDRNILKAKLQPNRNRFADPTPKNRAVNSRNNNNCWVNFA